MFRKLIPALNCYSRRLSLQKLDGFDWSKQVKILMEPYEYIDKLPCKHHALMAPAFNPWLRIPEEKLDIIKKAMQTLVTWSILFDDLQDESADRYGVPSAHNKYGVSLTINAASNTLLMGEKQVMELRHALAPEITFKRMEEFFQGQGCDIYWRNNHICPSEEVHIEMITKKSGSWFAFPVELMQLFSNNKTDYTELAVDIGIYYEILDGYYNLFHSQALPRLTSAKQEKYNTASDITECKISLAIVHASQFPDVATELGYILKQRTSDPKLKSRAIELLKKHGSDEYVRDTLRKREEDIRMKIDQLGGNPVLMAFMDDLTFQNKETGLD